MNKKLILISLILNSLNLYSTSQVKSKTNVAYNIENTKQLNQVIFKDKQNDTKLYTEYLPKFLKIILEKIKNKELLDILPNKFIFYGPPGNGKRTLSKAIAQLLSDCEYLEIECSDLSDTQIIAAKSINEVIDKALSSSSTNVVILFNDIDALVKKNSKNGGVVSNLAIEFLAKRIYKLKYNKKIKIICTANDLKSLNLNFLDIFNAKTEIFEIKKPNGSYRLQLFKDFGKQNGLTAVDNENAFVYAAIISKGLNTRDIKEILNELSLRAKIEGKKYITFKELIQSIETTKKVSLEKKPFNWIKSRLRLFIHDFLALLNTYLNYKNVKSVNSSQKKND